MRPGENIFRIAQYYQVSVSAIMEANRIRDERALQIGERLWIPEARRRPPGLRPDSPAREPPAMPGSERVTTRSRTEISPSPGRSGGASRGASTLRKGRRHEGIDLAAKPGTLIRASESGRVIYSGNGLGGYGNVVIVRHGKLYATVYAHNRKNRVRKGAFVDQGEVIAEVGKTGNATGPHLHFEIRRGERARDPLDYLP